MRKNLYEFALPKSRTRPRRQAGAAGEPNRLSLLRLDLPFHAAESGVRRPIAQPTRPVFDSMEKLVIAFPAERMGRGRAGSYPVTLRYNFADFLAGLEQPELESGERYDTLYQPSEIAAALPPRMSRR